MDYVRNQDGRWSVSVHELEGCFTYGKTLAQARERVREAIAVSMDDRRRPRGGKVVDHVNLPPKARAALKRAASARARVESIEAAARESTAEAVRALVEMGVSVRDAGELLGLSHQRVHQITHASR